jgi:hypothetical protein
MDYALKKEVADLLTFEHSRVFPEKISRNNLRIWGNCEE